MAGALGCRGEAPAPAAPADSATATPSRAPSVPPSPAAPVTTPASVPTTRAAAERAIAQLEREVRAPAGDPDNPWALAHGLLAFGKDFQTRDGESALRVAASFAEPDHGAKGRYGFPTERGDKPVEPHAYLLLKTFLEIGVAPDLALRAADGVKIDVRRLLADLRASASMPTDDAHWHDAAWWLAALELGGPDPGPAHERLRLSALERLEADDAVLASASGPDPFAASAPMGAAKRNKTHVYGHPCGGLHFVQAVLRAAAGSGSEYRARTRAQLALLLRRHDAERALYGQTLSAHPDARLLVSGQQLKFFGHLLETLTLADQLGLLRDDSALAEAVTAARRRAAADTLATLQQLEQEHAYARLPELAAQRPQLFLDLIGDGCHVLHGLRETLSLLPED